MQRKQKPAAGAKILATGMTISATLLGTALIAGAERSNAQDQDSEVPDSVSHTSPQTSVVSSPESGQPATAASVAGGKRPARTTTPATATPAPAGEASQPAKTEPQTVNIEVPSPIVVAAPAAAAPPAPSTQKS